MPYKSHKSCSEPGWPNVTDGRYCEAHKNLAHEEAQEHNHFYNESRRN